MPERLHPGVYVEEVSSGIRPIEGVSTSVAAFVGKARRGQPEHPHFLTSYREYERKLGSTASGEDGFLPEALAAFFRAGGRKAYAVRVLPDDAKGAVTETLGVREGTQNAVTFLPRGKGAWPHGLRLDLEDSRALPETHWRLVISEVRNGLTEVLEVHDELSMNPRDENYFVEVLKDNSLVITGSDLLEGALASSTVAAVTATLETGTGGADRQFTVYEGSRLRFTLQNLADESAPAVAELTFASGMESADGIAIDWENREAKLGAAQLLYVLRRYLRAPKAKEDALAPAPFELDSPGSGDTVRVRPRLQSRGEIVITGPDADWDFSAGGTVQVTINGTTSLVAAARFPDPSAVSAQAVADELMEELESVPGIGTPVVDSGVVTLGYDQDPASGGATVAVADLAGVTPSTVEPGATQATVQIARSTAEWGFTGDRSITVEINGTQSVLSGATLGGANPTDEVVQARLIADFEETDGIVSIAIEGSHDLLITFDQHPDAAPALTPAGWGTAVVNLPLTPAVGVDGLSPHHHDSMRLSVLELPAPGNPRMLGESGDWGLPALARGYSVNNPENPALRPKVTRNADGPVRPALRFSGGTDGKESLDPEDYRRGLRALDKEDVNIVALPGLNEPDFIVEGMSYCDGRGDCFFIADGPGGTDFRLEPDAEDARRFVQGLSNRSRNAAMFYPWIRVTDDTGIGRSPTRYLPPSGHVAGIFARTDINRGVWKAPAGIEATVTGALDLQFKINDAEQDQLNPIGMNCLRQFPSYGIVSWGTRTLSTDPEWRYIPVRRTALFLKKSLEIGLKWAVFEPNDEELWSRIRTNITAFMLSLFREGAFQGSTPDEAFRVICDRTTNPQERIDQGIVTAEVAFAPLKPAEFVVIQLSQKTLLTV